MQLSRQMTKPAIRRPSHALSQGALLTAAIVAMPILAVLWIAIAGGDDSWRHVMTNVVPRATGRTMELLLLTGLVTAVVGIVTAWLVTTFDFPLRRLLSIVLVLPLAIPSYLAAYAFGEFFDFTGPLQSGYRALFGFQTSVPWAAPCWC
mgnify:FL=1